MNVQYIDTHEKLQTALGYIIDAEYIALDTETTGLNPRLDKVRLLSLVPEDSTTSYVVDLFKVPASQVLEVLPHSTIIAHNAMFDLGFLGEMGMKYPKEVIDTLILSQLLTAGTTDRNDLKTCCLRHLNTVVSKEERLADWSGTLTKNQITYSARDAYVLPPLAKELRSLINKYRLGKVAHIEHSVLPAIMDMTHHGVGLDRKRWKELEVDNKRNLRDADKLLDELSPDKPGMFPGFWKWDWNSPKDSLEALHLVGCRLDSTADQVLAEAQHPLAEGIRKYREYTKLLSTYGTEWLDSIKEERIHPQWRQLRARSGRMSCGNPNLQQIPRGSHRSCIVPAAGNVLIKADYSQIELRIAAKVSGDKNLLQAYMNGEDLHTKTATLILGTSNKEARQLAKALNFGLLYGLGAAGLKIYAMSNYGVTLTMAQADEYREAFFNAYPGLRMWHREASESRATETRTLCGRRRIVDITTPMTIRLNTPVQGSGADGMKIALGLLHKSPIPGAFPIMAVHDEIVLECAADAQVEAEKRIKVLMKEAMAPIIHPIPVEVETKVSSTW